MFNRFTGHAREVVTSAVDIAGRLGSRVVEAEHLMLAVAELGSPAGDVLAGLDLDAASIREAIASEHERSLATVGVSLAAFDLPPISEVAITPRLAASAKVALERSLHIATGFGDRRIESAHILLGVLQASGGTVPRALAGAGVDRVRVINRVEALLR